MITEGASASGIATLAGDRVLDVYYPEPQLGAEGAAGMQTAGQGAYDEVRGVTSVPVHTSIASLADPPADACRRLPAPAPALAPADPAA